MRAAVAPAAAPLPAAPAASAGRSRRFSPWRPPRSRSAPSRPAARPRLLRFTISSASGASIVAGAGNSAISPDGRRVVFVGSDGAGRQGLWIQELDQVRARFLAGTEGSTYPFWAPDSRSVAFFAKGKLRKVSLDDGRVEAICEAAEGRGGSWGRAGTIVFAGSVTGPISGVSADGGTPKPVTAIGNPEKEISHRFPSFLPDGRKFLYLADPGTGGDEGTVYLASLDGGERRLLFRSRRAPVYAAPGYLIYATDDRLVAQSIDPKTGALGGEPRRLEEATPSYVNTQDRAASVSDSGALMVPAVQSGGTKIAWLDRRGRLVGEVPLPRENFASPQLSPDGRRLALFSDGPKESEADLWVVDLATEKASRLTFAPGLDRYPDLVSRRPATRLPDRALRRLRPLGAPGDERRRRDGPLRVADELEVRAQLGRRLHRLRDGREGDRVRRLAAAARAPFGASGPPAELAGDPSTTRRSRRTAAGSPTPPTSRDATSSTSCRCRTRRRSTR